MANHLTKSGLDCPYGVANQVDNIHLLRARVISSLPPGVTWNEGLTRQAVMFPMDALRAAVNNFRQKD